MLNQGGTTGHASSLASAWFLFFGDAIAGRRRSGATMRATDLEVSRMTMVEELNELYERALAALAAAEDPAMLAEWKSTFLGKQGAFTRLSRGLGALPAEERPVAGQQVN